MVDITIKSNFHNYRVHFSEDMIVSLSKEIKPKDIILIDEKVDSFYPEIKKEFANDNLLISINANEENKSYRGVEKIIDTLIRSNFRKNHRLIGIGGGIVQDITAFTASVMYRGVEWIFFPTTLLAQGDSCIGSKTSINFGKFKNQIGGFYP